MPSAEASPLESPTPRKLGVVGEGVSRKPSFKCGGPGRGPGTGPGPRPNRRSTSVQALTTKFDQMASQTVHTKRPGARVTIGRPKKFAKPTITPELPKSKVVKEVDCTETAKVSSIKAQDIPHVSNSNLNRNPAIMEPIYEKPCLPVKTAIDIFEKVSSEKPTKPVAAVKPILKTVDEKSKPKLAPKDSLCRVRYKVMRRTKNPQQEKEDSALGQEDPKIILEHNSESTRPNTLFSVAEGAISTKLSISQDIKDVKSVGDHESVCEANINVAGETVPSVNKSSLFKKGVNLVCVQLRKELEAQTLEALKERLQNENIVVAGCAKLDKRDSTDNPRKTLNDIFNQISQSTVLPRNLGEKQGKNETKTGENSENQDKSVFNRISHSEVAPDKGSPSKERRFATLLKKEGEDVDLMLMSVGGHGMDVKLTKVDKAKDDEEEIAVDAIKKKEENNIVKEVKNEAKSPENWKPNLSFLWSKPSPESEVPCNLKLSSTQGMGDKPLPKPPDEFIPDCFYYTVGQRDDRNSLKSDDGTEYDDISIGDSNDTYDDIGVLSCNQRNQTNSLYCISEKLDSLNIYEDIQSLRATMEHYECIEKLREEKADDDACYESIYGGQMGHSDDSVKSSFEKNNSLYESSQEIADMNNLYESSNLLPSPSSGECSSEVDTNSDYQTTGHRVGSDISNSDEWVEVSDSDSEQELYPAHLKSKRHRSILNGQSKPRANWSQLQKKTSQKTAQEDLLASSNDDHFYESIPLSETLETTTTTDDLADDSSCIDDFESSEEEFLDGQLPAEPAPQYNLTKSLRAAGKRLRQNLTLRKSDFSKSLKKLRPKLRTDVYDDKTESESSSGASKFYCDVGGGPKGQRPNGPPPPPPVQDNASEPTSPSSAGSGVQYADVRVNGTELYVESGLFKQRARFSTGSRSSWYTQAGLYGTNGKCPIPDSKNQHILTDEPLYQAKSKPMFTDEPLYQFYTECVNAQARDDILQHYDSDGYEVINDYYSLINDKRTTLDVKVPMPNLEDFGSEPDRPLPSFQTANRTLWCQVPEVENSCIVATLTEQQRKLQEAKFEILTSEGSYIHSLTVLETHFMPRLTELISGREHRLLFSNILAVKAVSERLLRSLEACWRDDIMLMGICDVVKQHAEEDFHVYVKFCKHHTAVYRTLRSLIDTNPAFAGALKRLESSQACHNLSLHSFLLLPMQRITRLPLLLGGVLSRLNKTDEEYLPCKNAFDLLNKIVRECDEEATRMEKCEEMLVLSQQLVFPKAVRRIPIISGNRCLVKRGSATLLLGKEDSKMTFGRKMSKTSIHLLLFTDLLVLARRKRSRGLMVVDFCPRNLVQLEPSSPPTCSHKHLMLLTLLENHDNKTVEMMLSLSLESDLSRWRDAVSPVLSDNPLESVYEAWDCPQVIVINEFIGRQPDELSLCIGDIVNVLKKIPDGWYQGERLRDGTRGWFPSNHTQEISSPHVRAKNKKQRYKLLALSGSYLQKK